MHIPALFAEIVTNLCKNSLTVKKDQACWDVVARSLHFLSTMYLANNKVRYIQRGLWSGLMKIGSSRSVRVSM